MRKLLILQGVCILCLLALCFQKKENVFQFTRESMQTTGKEGEQYAFASDSQELFPGVYEITVCSHLADNEQLVFLLESDSVFYKCILSNSVTLTGEQTKRYFVWVLDRVPVHVSILTGIENLEDGMDACVTWTSRGYGVLATLLAFLFLALDGLLLFRRGVIKGRISRENQIVFWIILAGVFLAFFPYLSNYFYIGSRGLEMIAGIEKLAWTMRRGSFLWDRSTFVFFFPALLLWIGFPFYLAWQIWVLLILALTAGISYSVFHKCFQDKYAAVLGALVYLLNPISLSNVYLTGAIDVAVAALFMPMCFLGICQLVVRPKVEWKNRKNLLFLVSGLVTMFLSKPTMVGVVLLLIAAMLTGVLANKKRRFSRTVLLCVGILTVFIGVFQVDQIAFQTRPVFLYDAQNIGMIFTE